MDWNELKKRIEEGDHPWEECFEKTIEITKFNTELLLPLIRSSISTNYKKCLDLISKVLSETNSTKCKEYLKYPVVALGIESIAFVFQNYSETEATICLSNSFRHIFAILSRTKPELKYWNILNTLKQRIDFNFTSPSESVKASSVLFMVNLVITNSNPVNLNNNLQESYLKKENLIKEANKSLDRLVYFLQNISMYSMVDFRNQCSASFLSLVLNSMFIVLNNRPHYTDRILMCLFEFHRQDLSFLSSLGLKTVNRTLRNVLFNCYSLSRAQKYVNYIYEILLEFGVSPRDIQIKLERLKRNIGEEAEFVLTEDDLEQRRVLGQEILKRGIMRVPVEMVIEIIARTLSERDPLDLEQDIQLYLSNHEKVKSEVQGDTKEEQMEIEQEYVNDDLDIDSILTQQVYLNDDEKQQLLLHSMQRILQHSEFFKVDVPGFVKAHPMSVSASKHGWTLLVSRILSQTDNVELLDLLLEFVFGDFRGRMDVALHYLFQVYYSGVDLGVYQSVLKQFLGMMKYGRGEFNGLDPRDRIFTKFLVEVPWLDDASFVTVEEYCLDKERVQLGIASLRDFVIYRPAVRDRALKKLLEYATSEGEECRVYSIMALVGFIKTLPDIKDVVCKVAEDALFSLQEYEKVEVVEEGMDVDQDSMKVLAKSQLYIATCSQHLDFFNSLFQKFVLFPGIVKKYINISIVSVIKEMTTSNPSFLFDILKTFPGGSEQLVLTVVRVMLEDPDLMSQTREECKSIFIARKLNFNFMVLCLELLSREEILDNLYTMVEYLQDPECKEQLLKNAILKVCVADSLAEQTEPRITPSEFMTRVHLLDEKRVSVLLIKKVTDLCFAEGSVFNQECLAIVLSRLAEESILPTLMMRTLIQSVAKFPRLVGFTNTLLGRLVGKQLFSNPTIWEGLVRYCTLNFPSCLPFLLDLPVEKGRDVVKASKGLKESMEKYISGLPAGEMGRREVVGMKRLLE